MPRLWVCLACLLLPAAVLGACASAPKDRLGAPNRTVAPYSSVRGDVIWAVAPVRNESGTIDAETDALGDRLVAAAEEIEGVRCVPLNRTIEAMRVLGMSAVRTPGDARTLARAMGVDGILVATLTQWEPYTPKLGIALALYAAPDWAASADRTIDPRVLSSSPTVRSGGGSRYADSPTATASRHFDGKDHQVLHEVKSFADGRLQQPTALGWRRYLASMELFSEFASFQILHDLMGEEWLRSAVVTAGHEGEVR